MARNSPKPVALNSHEAHEHAADRAGAQVHPPGVVELAAEGDAAAPRDPRGVDPQFVQLLLRRGLKAGMDHGEKIVAAADHMVLDAPGQGFFVDRCGVDVI